MDTLWKIDPVCVVRIFFFFFGWIYKGFTELFFCWPFKQIREKRKKEKTTLKLKSYTNLGKKRKNHIKTRVLQAQTPLG